MLKRFEAFPNNLQWPLRCNTYRVAAGLRRSKATDQVLAIAVLPDTDWPTM